jgi:hypothetical protein
VGYSKDYLVVEKKFKKLKPKTKHALLKPYPNTQVFAHLDPYILKYSPTCGIPQHASLRVNPTSPISMRTPYANIKCLH